MLQDGAKQFRGVYHPASQEKDATDEPCRKASGILLEPIAPFLFLLLGRAGYGVACPRPQSRWQHTQLGSGQVNGVVACVRFINQPVAADRIICRLGTSSYAPMQERNSKSTAPKLDGASKGADDACACAKNVIVSHATHARTCMHVGCSSEWRKTGRRGRGASLHTMRNFLDAFSRGPSPREI
jgi:hypothetical protein